MLCQRHILSLVLTLTCLLPRFATIAVAQELASPKPDHCLRIATYNVSLNRPNESKLTSDLQSDDAQARAVAAVIRSVRPDILLINELDYSTKVDHAELFATKYLADPATDLLGGQTWNMPYHYSSSVNTGVPSGLDLNNDGQIGGPNDAWGYGRFPGQYGMAVLSRYEIDRESVRSLQNFPWSKLPGALRPNDEASDRSFYNDATWTQLRLSSKSFWDVPINTPAGTIHVLASHPTPPAFDGPEDRNGCRNHDEIRLIQDYIDAASHLIDDQGRPTGLARNAAFVVLGDLNSDPSDGGSRPESIISLLNHPRVAQFAPPQSKGAVAAAISQAGANADHQGNAAEDTGDFNDRNVGNLRIDYALPSANFTVRGTGVVWPDLQDIEPKKREAVRECMTATDHHLVWVDIQPNP